MGLFGENYRTIKRRGVLPTSQIAALETDLGIVFPDDYKRFLQMTNGGTVPIGENEEKTAILIPALNEKVWIDSFFGVTEDTNSDIRYWNTEYGGEMLENAIIIGDSIMHGFFVLICGGENEGVYYWDDSYHFEQSDDERNTYYIAENFTDFIKQIKD